MARLSGRSRKRNHKHQWLGFTRVCWEAFEICRCQSETYEPVFCTGDLGMVGCGGDLLSQRKQALCILSGAGILSLVWPASSAGEWIPKACVKPGRRPKTWETSVWSIATWSVNQNIVGNFTQTSLSFSLKQFFENPALQTDTSPRLLEWRGFKRRVSDGHVDKSLEVNDWCAFEAEETPESCS